MSIDRRNHPCLTCPLPDCDDRNPRCPLRQILSKESTMRKRGDVVSDELRHLRSIAYYEIYQLERKLRESDRRRGVPA